MKRNIFNIICTGMIISMLIISCKDDEEIDTDTQSSIDNSYAEDAVNQAFSTVNHHGINEEGIKSGSATQPAITITPAPPDTTFPKTMTIDFGTDGIVGLDGLNRKGKIIAEFSGHWRNAEPNTSATITFENFSVNNIQRSGTYTVTVNSPNAYGGPSHSIEVENGKLVFSNGDEISWNSTKTIDWIEGFPTVSTIDTAFTNDVFKITGSSSGVNRRGLAYNMQITDSLKQDMSCTNKIKVTEGSYQITPEGKKTRTVNFGDGTCDNMIKVSVEGLSFDVSL